MIHILVNTAEGGKIVVDILLRLLARNADVFCKRKCSDSVNNAEIDSLCTRTEFLCNHINRQAENLWCGCRVNINAAVESVYHIFIIWQIGKHTKFDLAVIGINKRFTVACNKEFAQFPAERRSYRDILQIRLERADSAGARFNLIKRGVNPAVGCDNL